MRLALAAVLAVVLAGCGDGGDGGDPTPTRPAEQRPATTTADDRAEEAVVRGWADALRHGDVEAATDRFAVPAIVANGTPEIRLETRRQVRSFNESLPCGARVTEIVHHQGVLLATFLLTERPGGQCGSGVGALVRTAFDVRDGHIVRWLRLPDPGSLPPDARAA